MEAAARTGKVGIGIIGAGVISDIYLKNLTSVMPNTRVIGIADLLVERAQARADTYDVGAFSVEELLAHPEVEIVVNLTIPKAHGPVAQQVVEAGKSVYNEKPLTLSRAEAETLRATAQANGVLVGCAPDTFLGGGLQSARKVIDDGLIGTPVAATAAMITRGHERWHPDPSFYYQPGAGPMLDMGPYYVTALVSILGPVTRVASSAKKSFPERTITSRPKAGEKIPVNVDTHIVATLDFASDVTATLMTSFDLFDTERYRLSSTDRKAHCACRTRTPSADRCNSCVAAARSGRFCRSRTRGRITTGASACLTWPVHCARVAQGGHRAILRHTSSMSCTRRSNRARKSGTFT
jgi:predicted dehydrogenase